MTAKEVCNALKKKDIDYFMLVQDENSSGGKGVEIRIIPHIFSSDFKNFTTMTDIQDNKQDDFSHMENREDYIKQQFEKHFGEPE